MKYFNDLSSHLKSKNIGRIFKVSLDSGFGCPNWKNGGCSFCQPASYSPIIESKIISIRDQMTEGLEYLKKRHGGTKGFIANFQVGTSTNAKTEIIDEQLKSVLKFDEVVGIAISTRPDCLSDDCLDLLADYNKKIKIFWLELGLQTSNDEILKKINRGHTSNEFELATKKANERGINVCAHVIIGLPNEPFESIMTTAEFINKNKVWGVKIHNLHIVKGTLLEKDYQEGKAIILTLNEYASYTVDFIERLSPEIIIHRINAHAPRNMTIAPTWSINKLGVMNAIVNEFRKRGSKQGDKLPDCL